MLNHCEVGEYVLEKENLRIREEGAYQVLEREKELLYL